MSIDDFDDFITLDERILLVLSRPNGFTRRDLIEATGDPTISVRLHMARYSNPGFFTARDARGRWRHYMRSGKY